MELYGLFCSICVQHYRKQLLLFSNDKQRCFNGLRIEIKYKLKKKKEKNLDIIRIYEI